MNRLTIACVWVTGNVNYTANYVARLKSMCARSAPAHEFVCLTDRPEQIPDINSIVIKPYPKIPGWWSKIQLFNSAHTQLQSGQILALDLDTLVVRHLQPIIDFSAGFSIVPDDAPNFTGRGALRTVKRYNSSVMSWPGGFFNDIYDRWSPSVAQRLWGDQDWIGELYSTLNVMPLPWFPRLSQVMSRGQVDARMKYAKVLLCKKPKNAEAAKLWNWFDKAWQ